MARIVVLGTGFAGLWSAIGAARKLDELGMRDGSVEVVAINARKHHSIRVRNYEADLGETLVPLSDVLDPIGVRWIEGAVSGIDVASRSIAIRAQGAVRPQSLAYDRLVVALGSRLVHPPIPGLAEHAFDVDTYEGALRLEAHLRALPLLAPSAGRYTAVVVGAGLTGVEIAAELPARLGGIAGEGGGRAVRVILADRNAKIGQAMGGAQPVIERAMNALGVDLMPNASLKSVEANGIECVDGERIDAATVIWCGGMRANPLTEQIPVERDAAGRLFVDAFMRVEGVPGVFAAGDCAHALIDGVRPSVMSCQHGRPMGRYAGHNVVCDLLGLDMLPLHIDWYTTILDLGPWGAVYTEGWDRHLVAEGDAAKRTKRIINGERIYPPRTRVREEILAAAAPVVQAPPPRGA
ncbi:NADH dehydrogenase [Paraburkholderia sp. BL8N3]|nr:FAD-dependent oxidoreductase [Paraburkholderia sp. BL8N3]TCK39592.1 NADH dehydrogenase [Paraburkholderia sp. BL8N3]